MARSAVCSHCVQCVPTVWHVVLSARAQSLPLLSVSPRRPTRLRNPSQLFVLDPGRLRYAVPALLVCRESVCVTGTWPQVKNAPVRNVEASVAALRRLLAATRQSAATGAARVAELEAIRECVWGRCGGASSCDFDGDGVRFEQISITRRSCAAGVAAGAHGCLPPCEIFCGSACDGSATVRCEADAPNGDGTGASSARCVHVQYSRARRRVGSGDRCLLSWMAGRWHERAVCVEHGRVRREWMPSGLRCCRRRKHSWWLSTMLTMILMRPMGRWWKVAPAVTTVALAVVETAVVVEAAMVVVVAAAAAAEAVAGMVLAASTGAFELG